MPIEVVSAVKFEDERVIDLGSRPHLTIQAKEEEKEQCEKVAGVDLHSLLNAFCQEKH